MALGPGWDKYFEEADRNRRKDIGDMVEDMLPREFLERIEEFRTWRSVIGKIAVIIQEKQDPKIAIKEIKKLLKEKEASLQFIERWLK